MNSLENQDRAVAVAAFRDGIRLASEAELTCEGLLSEESGRQRLAGLLGCAAQEIEVLKACLDHPKVPAVDCLICAPSD